MTLPARHRTSAVTALLVGAACLTPATAQAASPSRTAGALSAQVFVTTPDRGELMHQRAAVTFTPGTSRLTTITVDPTQRFQSMAGFGASITDSSAALLSAMPAEQREQTLRSLFDRNEGIGVSFLRQPLGSSDFAATDRHYTYDDMPAGETDLQLRHFSIAHDEQQILPLLRRAKQLNPSLAVLGTPWSPPAWMKTGDSLVGGSLKDDPAIYNAYARYLVKTVQAYAAAGVPLDYLTVQNEPQNAHPDAYPGTAMSSAQQIKVIEALGPMLAEVSPRTKILGYDHNWSTHPNDVASVPPGDDEYPTRLLESSAAPWISGTAFHCYYGDPSAQTALHEKFPAKDVFFTECSGSYTQGDTPEQIFRGTLTWHARNIVLGVTRNWGRTAVNWNLVLRSDGTPHLGGCGTCTGLVSVLPDGSVRTDAEYYTIGHLSKFVRPGAVRIASTSYGTTGWNGQLMSVAFTNPDGSTALVVHNENDAPRSFAVAVGDRRFEYTLPGGALATFTWPPLGAALRTLPHEVPLQSVAVSSSTPADAEAAADGDGSTRWSSGEPQRPGQWLQLDLRRPKVFHRIALDSGDNLGDYARGYRVEASVDGKHWYTVGSGRGSGQLTTIDKFTVARYLRVTTTASSPSWWSIADIRLYR